VERGRARRRRKIVYGKLKIAIKIYYQHSFDVRKLMARIVGEESFPFKCTFGCESELMVMWKIRLCDFYFGLRLWLMRSRSDRA
jgi:hypothetical protein